MSKTHNVDIKQKFHSKIPAHFIMSFTRQRHTSSLAVYTASQLQL